MGRLRVALATPDPPFSGMPDGGGLDLDVIAAIAEKLDRAVQLVEFADSDLDAVFDGLSAGSYDCVIAGGVGGTEAGQRRAAFAPPYLISGRAVAVDTARLPRVRAVEDLAGLTIGVRRGDTGGPIAERLVDAGRAGRVQHYGSLGAALHDLGTGGCDAVMALTPVLAEAVKPRPGIEVVRRGLSTEEIAIAVAPSDTDLLNRIATGQAELEADGTLQQIRRRWLGNPFTDQHLVLH
ncbi:ABC transporter substrate-binding protein [Mycobacterium sp. NPDC003449]